MVTIYGKSSCGFCINAKHLCESMNLKYEYLEAGEDYSKEDLFKIFPNAKTFPQIKIGDNIIGGFQQLQKYIEDTGYNGTGYTLS